MKQALFLTTAIGACLLLQGLTASKARADIKITTTTEYTYDFPDSTPRKKITSQTIDEKCPPPFVCSGGGNTPCSGPGSCFEYNTLVKMADGSLRKIGEIAAGDMTAYGVVRQAFIRRYDQDHMMTEAFQQTYQGGLYTYRGILVTGNHRVHHHGQWKMVADTEYAIPAKAFHAGTVYNLDVDGGIIPVASEDGSIVNFLDDKQAFVSEYLAA